MNGPGRRLRKKALSTEERGSLPKPAPLNTKVRTVLNGKTSDRLGLTRIIKARLRCH